MIIMGTVIQNCCFLRFRSLTLNPTSRSSNTSLLSLTLASISNLDHNLDQQEKNNEIESNGVLQYQFGSNQGVVGYQL